MKNKEKKEEEIPLLVHNLTQMHEYPNLFSNGHWDILIGTLKMIFTQFPEVTEYLNNHDIEDNDQKYFKHKLKDLMAVARGEMSWTYLKKTY